MKTAISIPDPVFERADRLARQKGVSRSELYVTAIEEYIQRYDEECITEQLNRVYTDEPSEMDPVLQAMVLATWAKMDEGETW